ncbi:DUF4105 domain-containing protein [Catenovulum sp. SX2]|uniref:Lnb N-terminal periplasmic domain-containing protein n=1 Tax=Catenovulum sp. SX2 TaxID=3398614 RepID=UPI003F851237
MLHKYSVRLIVCLSFFFSFNSLADQLINLAKQRYWLDLLHFHQAGFIAPNQSQIDSAAFFLSPSGKTDAYAELVATVAAFKGDLATNKTVKTQCLFPARYHWLSKQLPELKNYQTACPEFSEWRDTLSPEKIYLVFPAAYLNSPSSMYGHTLLRIKKTSSDNALLDYAVNYAANPDPNDNQLVFSYKGLAGMYPGVFSIMPYYEKVTEYGSLESRDIWEYELDLTEEEVLQFVRHIWEVRDIYMDYYFFSENCAYQLLSMVDASSERISLLGSFRYRSIPTDTIRALVENDYVKSVEYRPSILSQMRYLQAGISEHDLQLAKAIVEQAEYNITGLQSYSNSQQAKLLELAYHYSRYLAAKKKSSLAHLGKRSIQLLSDRSKLQVQQNFTSVPSPKHRDDEGHATQRLLTSIGLFDGESYLEIEYRPAYHDLLDPAAGYMPHSQLEMFSFKLNLDNDSQLRFEQLKLIGIRSLSPSTGLFTSNSWQVDFGWKRFSKLNDTFSPYLTYAYGQTYEVLVGSISFLAGVETYVHSRLPKGYYLAAGPEVNYFYQGENQSWVLQYKYLRGDQDWLENQHKLEFSQAFNLSRAMQFRYAFEYKRIEDVSFVDAKLGLAYYF